MFSQHPAMAKRWAAHTPKGAKLPEHVSEDKKSEKKALAQKLAVALQSQQLIPGAPPVKKLVGGPGQPLQGAQQPNPQGAPGPTGIPQQAVAPIPQAPQASDVLTQQKAQRPMQQHPGAVTNSEAIVAEKINKMAAMTYAKLLGRDLRNRLGK
jgi:hypothetical protein